MKVVDLFKVQNESIKVLHLTMINSEISLIMPAFHRKVILFMHLLERAGFKKINTKSKEIIIVEPCRVSVK